MLFYATSNRRHLVPRDMMENEKSTAINPGEATEEKVSLSDRFGLWIGFHNCSQDDYLEMVFGYVRHYGLDAPRETVRAEALEWSITRGALLGTRCMAVRPGSGGPAGEKARLKKQPRCQARLKSFAGLFARTNGSRKAAGQESARA